MKIEIDITPRWKGAFPKKRHPLPDRYNRIYRAEYLHNREGEGAISSLASRLEGWMHRKVAGSYARGKVTLELGAGTLNHICFEPESIPYDIVEPFVELYAGRNELSNIRSVYSSIHDIPEGTHYDRIISIAVLEHVLDLPETIARSGLLLSPRGIFSAGIPTEGGFLWYLAWRFGTGIPFYFRHGLDYGPLMRYEHVNDASEIFEVADYFFSEVSLERFPINALHASFYTHLKCRSPRHERCLEYIARSNVC